MAIDFRSLAARFARYLLSGGIVVAIDYSVFFLLDKGIGAGLALSQGSARLAGAVSGYFLQKTFVFGLTRRLPADSGLGQIVSYGALTLLNIGLSAWCADFLGNRLMIKPDLVVKLMTDAILAGETFLFLHFVFRDRSHA